MSYLCFTHNPDGTAGIAAASEADRYVHRHIQVWRTSCTECRVWNTDWKAVVIQLILLSCERNIWNLTASSYMRSAMQITGVHKHGVIWMNQCLCKLNQICNGVCVFQFPVNRYTTESEGCLTALSTVCQRLCASQPTCRPSGVEIKHMPNRHIPSDWDETAWESVLPLRLLE